MPLDNPSSASWTGCCLSLTVSKNEIRETNSPARSELPFRSRAHRNPDCAPCESRRVEDWRTYIRSALRPCCRSQQLRTQCTLTWTYYVSPSQNLPATERTRLHPCAAPCPSLHTSASSAPAECGRPVRGPPP